MLDAVDRIKRGDFTTLPEIHATSAGLKAFCTTLVSEGIEVKTVNICLTLTWPMAS
jgi:hypothetical protein